MSEKRDFYEILGCEKTASPGELKSAYRKLAVKWHPDKNQGDKAAEEKFKEISEAYLVLKDSDKRTQYDQFGHSAFEGGQGGASMDMNTFDDLFSNIFGGGGDKGVGFNIFGDRFSDLGRGFTIQIRGADITYRYDFTLEEILGGKKIVVTSASGKELSVDIPAGIENGTQVRIAGEGEEGRQGGTRGDLYILINQLRHEYFVRDRDDLHSKIPISMTTAALGGQIESPTIDGTFIKVKIPEGTQTGDVLKVPNKGMTRLKRGTRGDLRLNIFVETPTNLTLKQKSILRQLENEKKEKKRTI